MVVGSFLTERQLEYYATNTKDQAWTYDGLERLKTFDKGTLSGTTISGTPAREQDWTLDALGNWSGFVVKTSGTTNLNQARTHNKVNEITGVTASTGDNWYDPTFDLAGNMATGPRPSAPKDSDANGRKFKYTYDAWQRLVKVEESPTNTTSWTTLTTFAYNGLNERVIKIDVAPTPDVQYDYYYNHQWQVVEVRKDGDPDPLEQWLWHQHYIDAPAIRYYDDNTDGASVALQYFSHDANFNITALVNSSGSPIERYEYDPYGMLQIMDASFGNRSTSSYAQTVTYAGYRADAETGLYQVRNRYLDPGLGRWVTRDPIGYRGDGNNLFEYGHSAPHLKVDSMGTKCSISIYCAPLDKYYVGAELGFKHCGLFIDNGGIMFRIDGSGGDTNHIWWNEVGAIGVKNGELGNPFDYDDPVCSCLWKERKRWNKMKVPRDDATHNSNWTLKCLAKKCGVNLDWGMNGNPTRPKWGSETYDVHETWSPTSGHCSKRIPNCP